MSKLTTASQIAKLKSQIKKLEEKETLIAARNQNKALSKILALAKSSELTIEQIKTAMSKGVRAVKATKSKKASRVAAGSKSKLAGRKVAPKYRNPANKLETWAGRGRAPKWAAALQTAGKLDSALISQ